MLFRKGGWGELFLGMHSGQGGIIFSTEVENLHFLSGGDLTSPCSEFKGVIENQECSPEKFDHLVPLD